ncbi:MAG: 30S ribosomal protein S1 [Legionellales bacterium]|nr:MAG: 30S ribosomal protein S1 [Legionellales bacterium]
MTESFAELFAADPSGVTMYPGAVVTARVISISSEYVTVHTGLKSEGRINVAQFRIVDGVCEVAVGDDVKVVVETVDNGCGEACFSRDKARRMEVWDKLGESCNAREVVTGIVAHKVKGGFTVEVEGIRAFLPGSLADAKSMSELDYVEGTELELKIIKMDKKRNNIVVSRRAVLESDTSGDREELLSTLEEGQELTGTVKNLTDYGAFVDLGGIDGLLHITDMAWKRVNHPSEVVTVGQEMRVKVLKFDKEKARVSLGVKQLGEDPWGSIAERYPVNARLRGKVTNITEYGCFVELEDGVEGLVHVSEMDWTNKNINPTKVTNLGEEVDVMVLEIDSERRRISLGLKQCKNNPWDVFSEKYSKDDKLTGNIKSITDFGMFVGLDGEIDGLVHMSDISWKQSAEEALRAYKKGQEVDVVILAIDPERERISLGIKQLQDDPFGNYVQEHGKGSIVTGTVLEVEENGAVLELVPEVTGYLRGSDLEIKTQDVREVMQIGDKVEVKITNVDRKTRSLSISVRAAVAHEEHLAIKQINKEFKEQPKQTLGDLLKAKMGGGE